MIMILPSSTILGRQMQWRMHLAVSLVVSWPVVLEDWKRAVTIYDYDLLYYENDNAALDYNVTATPSLLQHAKETQWQDFELREIWKKLQNGEQLDGWSTNLEGFVYYNGILAIVNS